MTQPELVTDSEILKMQRDSQEKERDYCRQRKTDVFSWASSLLVGGIAGLFAISSSNSWIMSFPYPSITSRNVFICLVITIFAGYAFWWITKYDAKEDVAQKNLDCLETKLAEAKNTILVNVGEYEKAVQGFAGYRLCVLLLALAAICFVLFEHVQP